MRRTTRWAVFTSMNQPAPSSRPLEQAAGGDQAPSPDGDAPSVPDTQTRSTRDTRRDRVDFM